MEKRSFLFLIGGIFSLMIAIGIGRFAFTPILPLMQNALSFTNAEAGYLASSNYAGYFIGAILAGTLPLKNKKTIYLRISLFVSIFTTGVMGFSDNYLFFLVIRFVSGVASAFIFVSASSIVLDRLAGTDKTGWSGIFYSGVGFGIFFSTLFIPGLNRLFDWEGVWIGLAIISTILTIFVWFLLKEIPNKIHKKKMQAVTSKVPPLKWLPWLIAAYGLEGLGYIVTGTFIVSIADENPVYSIEPAFVWMVVGLTAIPSCIIWSTLAQKWGFVKTLMFSMILQSIGIALPVFWLTQSSFMISASLFGATFMGITTLATTLARQMSSSDSSRIIGYLTASYAAGQMIGPSIAGLLSTYTNSFNPALIGAAAIVFIGALLLGGGIRYDQKSI